MSQYLIVRLAKVLHEARTATLIHDRSSWDGGVHRGLDKAIESIAHELSEAGFKVDPAAFKLNAGHSGVTDHRI